MMPFQLIQEGSLIVSLAYEVMLFSQHINEHFIHSKLYWTSNKICVMKTNQQLN